MELNRRRPITRAWVGCLVVVVIAGWTSIVAAAPFRIIITETETPLVPNSVVDLALRLGYYKKAGVDVELVRVQQTPSAVAALRSSQGDMANLSLDIALQLVARDQMNLKGVFSPDKALPFQIVAKKEFTTVKQLEGKVFGVSRIGSVDYLLSRSVIAKLGGNPEGLRFLAVGQPSVRMQALLANRIDATTTSVGIYTTLADKSGLNIVVDQPSFYRAAPFVTKLDVVTEAVARTKSSEVQAVTRAIMMASRDFAHNPALWVDAMAQARPDVKRSDLEFLAENYRNNWSVNGGLSIQDIQSTTSVLYDDADWKNMRIVAPNDWIETRFVDAVLADSGITPDIDPPGRHGPLQ